MTATVVMMRIVTVGRLRAVGARIAGATAARLTLSHPAAKWIATAVIAIDLVDR